MKFYNREKELELLQQAVLQQRSAMVIISGRRRVGKSRLVDEFLKKNKGLKVIVVPKEEKQAAKDLAEVLAEDYKPSFNTIKEAFEYFFTKSKERVLYIDEFPNFLEINPSVPYELQRIWELYKEKTDKVLILSGSYVSMMDKIFTRQKAPLFNRATFKLILNPLSPDVVWHILSDISTESSEQKIADYCVFGGIPYYYELLERYEGAPSIEGLFFDTGQLHEEGQNILRQEFGSAYKKYFSILEAIGYGLVSTGEIANKMGIQQTTLSKYVMALQNDFKLIERMVPFDQNQYRSKKGVYVIRDNLLAFWFSFVYGKEQVPDKGQLNAFLGKRFEFLCRNYLSRFLQNKGERIEKTGMWWGSVEIEKGKFEQREIDLIVETDKALYIGECKWTEKKQGEKELEHLKQSAKSLKSKKPIKWVFFNKKGFNIKESHDVWLFDADRIVASSHR